MYKFYTGFNTVEEINNFVRITSKKQYGIYVELPNKTGRLTAKALLAMISTVALNEKKIVCLVDTTVLEEIEQLKSELYMSGVEVYVDDDECD